MKKEYDAEKGDFDVVKGLGSSDLMLQYYENSDDDPGAPHEKDKKKLSFCLCSQPAFGNIVCDLTSTSKKNFSVWTGFQARLVSKPAQNLEKDRNRQGVYYELPTWVETPPR